MRARLPPVYREREKHIFRRAAVSIGEEGRRRRINSIFSAVL